MKKKEKTLMLFLLIAYLILMVVLASSRDWHLNVHGQLVVSILLFYYLCCTGIALLRKMALNGKRFLQ